MACSMFCVAYGAYFLLVIRTGRMKQYLALVESVLSEEVSASELPNVSIVMPVYNEENVISRKIREITELDYPAEKLEVLSVNDCSTDCTLNMLEREKSLARAKWKILNNPQRVGTNACYNIGIGQATGDFILTTDADVTLDKEALMKAIKVLLKLQDIGGVTGRPVTISLEENMAVLLERSYRATFNKMSIAESAIHSTFPGNTACMILRKSSFLPMSRQYGSSDGNISLGIIRAGLRLIYVPQVFFYERVLGGLNQQKGQKTRRAARQIQSMLWNRDMLFKRQYGAFGQLILPLRFTMGILCPTLLLVGGILLISWGTATFPPLGLVMASLVLSAAFVGMKVRRDKMNLFSSSLVHEFYLVFGLVRSLQSLATWNRDGTK